MAFARPIGAAAAPARSWGQIPLGACSADWGRCLGPELPDSVSSLLAASALVLDLHLAKSGAFGSCAAKQIGRRVDSLTFAWKCHQQARYGLRALQTPPRRAANALHLPCGCPSPPRTTSATRLVWRAGGHLNGPGGSQPGMLPGPPAPSPLLACFY